MTATTSVAVDLGRTRCRVLVRSGDSEPVRLGVHGGAGIHDPGGPRRVVDVVEHAIAQAGFEPANADGGWQLGIAVPGASTGSDSAAEVAEVAAARWEQRPAQVVVVSDAYAWYAGALAGDDGAVLAVGTGAVAVREHAGEIGIVDGRGLLLGDEGGGAWIGLHALRSAARSAEESGGAGALYAAAVSRFGAREQWPGLLADDRLAATLAEFAPEVLRLADAGDAEAEAVRAAAAEALACTARRAVTPGRPVVLVGGVADDPGLRTRLLELTADLDWAEPRGDCCDGAGLLLADTTTALEPRLVRRPADPPAGSTPVREDIAFEVDHLPTESAHAGVALDELSTVDLVTTLVDGHARVPGLVRSAAAELAAASDLVAETVLAGGRLVYVGAGTPGRIAIQDAAELTPTFGLEPARTLVLLAGGHDAGTRAIENAEDDDVRARATVDLHSIGADDVVIGVSASGRTPYVVASVARAAERGAATVAVASVRSSPLSVVADLAVEIETGPEILAGSTRLAAGTAQKIVLNTMSTAAMVRAGRTYGPWMVDLVVTNAKLRRRAVRTVRDATGADETVAEETLTAADGSVKVALVMLLAGVGPADAEALLEERGSVRAAVAGVVR